MAKKMLIDATHAEETRVVVVDGNKVEEFDFESENKRQLAGNIYLAKVTRVEPSLQAAFVDYGGNRHGFLAFSEIHPDYYQIPVADREALMEEERAHAEEQRARDEEEEGKPRNGRSRGGRKSRAAKSDTKDATTSRDPSSADGVAEISGMETIELDPEGQGAADADEVPEGTSPMERVEETPVAEPEGEAEAASDAAEEQSAKPAPETGGNDNGNGNGNGNTRRRSDAAQKDDSIEAVADDDDQDDIRPPRKPRSRRYKIQEVIKVRQILLVQVVKEERGNKGAALTTYLSLAGRYCVLMPNTARGGGISRKITNAVDRKKLKEIATEIDVPKGAGLIVRTAGAKRTKTEIKRDYEYLQRLWEQIRELTLKSIAPAKIYEEGDLIKRSIRDLYNREIDEVFVEGERGYRIAKDFMKMIMPSHAKNVKHYTDAMPLFARYQVESYLSSMFNPTVQLKSGGYIVIGVTEALVAIDVNSGRATKEGSIEDTALKTNMEAAEEVARQLRLRDLAGLIVIDFIDMDERKNNAAVEKKIKDKLKTDRARIQVGRISGFGLMEMSRQRLRPGMIEATTQPCPHCHGTGLIRSDDNLALSILRQIEEEGVRRRSREVLVKTPVGIANYLMNFKREHVAQIEARYGLSVRVEGDPALISPDFSLEKFKTATRVVGEAAAPVVSVDTSLMDQIDEDTAPAATADENSDEAPAAAAPAAEEEGSKPKKRRRRRRRSGKSKSSNGAQQNGETQIGETGEAASEAVQGEAAAEPDTDAKAASDDVSGAEATEQAPKKPARKRPSRAKSAKAKAAEQVDAEQPADPSAEPEEAAKDAAPEAAGEAKAEKPKVKRTRKAPAKPKAKPAAKQEPAPEPLNGASEPAKAAESEATATPAKEEEATPQSAKEEAPAAAPEPAAEPAERAQEAPQPDKKEKKPKRRGWWSLGR
ncbi:MAG: ribonuclease E/G [Sediminimonas qiaohouensis]|uniref:Ribonuclease E n=1 Tax=Sediminimonas qiaohouensis TaxID=552061 RepID=A0A7C9HC30_9RHOB|nr:ribonuclease E/G [Sediminimonas qiaohouensis]MTJ05644.1 ribonuclease E/G [Sediminimonas qiaohouensis]